MLCGMPHEPVTVPLSTPYSSLAKAALVLLWPFVAMEANFTVSACFSSLWSERSGPSPPLLKLVDRASPTPTPKSCAERKPRGRQVERTACFPTVPRIHSEELVRVRIEVGLGGKLGGGGGLD